MALNLTKFKSDLKAALLSAQAKNQKDGVGIDTAMGNLADEIATQVDAYIKTAVVTITALPSEVQVVGSPSAQANAVSLTLKGGDATHVGGLS